MSVLVFALLLASAIVLTVETVMNKSLLAAGILLFVLSFAVQAYGHV